MSAEAVPVGGEDGRMTLVEHLTELRSRLIKMVLAIIAGMVIGFVLYPYIFDILVEPYARSVADGGSLTGGGDLIATDPLEPFAVRLKVAGYTGIALAMPVLLWQVWRFVTPGLYAHEKRYAVPFVGASLVLFVLGAWLAYFTLPQALGFLQNIGGSGIVTAYTPGKYLQLVTYMMLAFGIGFEFPIVLVFLQMVGVLHYRMLAKFRRYAIVAISILVAAITPSGDPYSMLVLSVPMVIFYEISIVIGRLIARRRPAEG